MAQTVRMSDAKAHLADLVRTSDDENVVLTRHGEPAAVLISYRRLSELLDQLDDYEDRLSVHEREGDVIDFAQLVAGLDRVDVSGSSRQVDIGGDLVKEVIVEADAYDAAGQGDRYSGPSTHHVEDVRYIDAEADQVEAVRHSGPVEDVAIGNHPSDRL